MNKYFLLLDNKATACLGFMSKFLQRDKIKNSKETSTQHPNIESAIRALQMGDLALLAASIGNTLQSVSEKLRPEIRQAINALREHGARIAQMTGSGSAVFGVFRSRTFAQKALSDLSASPAGTTPDL